MHGSHNNSMGPASYKRGGSAHTPTELAREQWVPDGCIIRNRWADRAGPSATANIVWEVCGKNSRAGRRGKLDRPGSCTVDSSRRRVSGTVGPVFGLGGVAATRTASAAPKRWSKRRGDIARLLERLWHLKCCRALTGRAGIACHALYCTQISIVAKRLILGSFSYSSTQ